MPAHPPAPTKPHAPAYGKGSRSQPGEIRPVVRTAIERMVELGQPWDEAARAVGLDARAMRKQLERPAVLQLLRRRRQVAREAASAGNIKRLVELRDQSTNLMAATKAVQLLENMGDDHATSRGIVTSPGLVVVIQGANARVQPAKPTIDVEPVRGLDPGRDDGVDG